MKILRIAALAAAPVAVTLALTACGGGGGSYTGVATATGQTSEIRFVDGDPTIGNNVDVYFQSANTAAPTTPVAGNIPYGEATDFIAEPIAAATVIVRTAGASSGSTALTSCPIPQTNNNDIYSVVLVSSGGVHNCMIFQDSFYSSSGTTGAVQYRFHNASPNAAASAAYGNPVAYGTTTAPGTPGQPVPYNANQTASLGTLVTASGASWTQVPAAGPSSNTGSISYAAGPNTSTAGDFTATNTLDQQYVFAPNSLTPAASGNNAAPTGANITGTSIFLIDCSTTGPTANNKCISGATLVGVEDTK